MPIILIFTKEDEFVGRYILDNITCYDAEEDGLEDK